MLSLQEVKRFPRMKLLQNPSPLPWMQLIKPCGVWAEKGLKFQWIPGRGPIICWRFSKQLATARCSVCSSASQRLPPPPELHRLWRRLLRMPACRRIYATFAPRGPVPADAKGTTIVPSTGMGGFNARYDPASMVLTITLNLAMTFLDGMKITGHRVTATQKHDGQFSGSHQPHAQPPEWRKTHQSPGPGQGTMDLDRRGGPAHYRLDGDLPQQCDGRLEQRRQWDYFPGQPARLGFAACQSQCGSQYPERYRGRPREPPSRDRSRCIAGPISTKLRTKMFSERT